MGRRAKSYEEKLATKQARQRTYYQQNTARHAGPSNLPTEPPPPLPPQSQAPVSAHYTPSPSPPSVQNNSSPIFDYSHLRESLQAVAETLVEDPQVAAPDVSSSQDDGRDDEAPTHITSGVCNPGDSGSPTCPRSASWSEPAIQSTRPGFANLDEVPVRSHDRSPTRYQGSRKIPRQPAREARQSSASASPTPPISARACRPGRHETLLSDDSIPDDDLFQPRSTAVSEASNTDTDGDLEASDTDTDGDLEASDTDTDGDLGTSPEDNLTGLRLSADTLDPDTAAQRCLDRSWQALCECDSTYIRGTAATHSLAECTAYLTGHLPGTPPLECKTHLRRQGQHNDFREVHWRELLGGRSSDDGLRRALSIAKSAEVFAQAEQRTEPWVRRSYDVDSFFARVTTLAVHWQGFRLAYCPPYLQTITQDPYVTFRARRIHTTKQLRLGSGVTSAGFGYETYVFFPYMPQRVKGRHATYHVNKEQQQVWIDEIILPALRSTCDAQVCARHPGSFEDATCKAQVKQEAYGLPSGAIDVSYPVPFQYLASFWSAVCRHADNHPLFKDAFLVVQGHDLKHYTTRSTPAEARDDFLDHLHGCFQFREDYFPPEDCWVDFGIEETPVGDTSQAITLLRKTGCLEHWAQAFHDPDKSAAGVKEARYPWFLTQDAGSMSVQVRPRNSLHQKGGIAYPKAYNLIKNLFSTPLKSHGTFSNPHFEALGFSQSNLAKWYEANQKGSSSAHQRKHQQLVGQYNATKIRLHAALKAAENPDYRPPPRHHGRRAHDPLSTRDGDDQPTVGSSENGEAPTEVLPTASRHRARDFGARQECRMNLTRFRNMTFDAVDDSRSTPSSTLTHVNDGSPPHDPSAPHLPYWILPTVEVLRFIAITTNRWLLHLEVIIAKLEPGGGDLTAMTTEDEHIYGVVVMALLRTLVLSFGGQDPRAIQHRALWRDDWTVRVDDDGDSGTPTTRLGLGYRSSIDKYGMVWVREDIMRWFPLPYFSPDALERLGLTRSNNAFQKSFRRPKIASLLNEHHQFDTRWRNWCAQYFGVYQNQRRLKAWVEKTAELAAQLVVREYNLEVFDILAYRTYIPPKQWASALTEGRTRPCPALAKCPSRQAQKEYFLAQLDDDERQGLCMLTPGLVARLTGAPPRIVIAREPGGNGREPFFAPYHESGLWEDRVRALFAFDERDMQGKRRTWERSRFRTLVKDLWQVFHEVLDGPPGQRSWEKSLARHASHLMPIILQYDGTRIACSQKVGKHNRSATQQAIRATPLVQRTNWWACRLPERLHAFVERVDRQVEARRTMTAVTRALRGVNVQTLTDANRSSDLWSRGVFCHLDVSGVDTSFEAAKTFLSTT